MKSESPITASNSHEGTPLLDLRGMVKSYPGCLANDQVDLTLMPGQIHALLGENGAGKSTLVKMIYGVLRADQGDIEWQGAPVTINNPSVARGLGIAMVFQHFSLFESLTVSENIALGLGDSSGVNTDSLDEDIVTISARYGLPLDPERYVYTLSVGERQRIEIVRCLLQNPKLLIMDEPTSVLTPQEVDTLFKTLRQLSSEGVAILYISHKLDEIKALCHHATILRGGRVVGIANPATESASSLASMMIGQDVTPHRLPESAGFGPVSLACQSLTLPAADSFSVKLDDINLSVRAGEILGIAGVAGNGQDELINALSGEILLSSADMVQFKGQPVGRLMPGSRRQIGLCVVPEERLGHAAVPGMSLAENAFLTGAQRLSLSRVGFIRHRASRQFASRVIDAFQVQCRGSAAAADSLSGGNLQKFVVGREILQKPEVLVVAQPTWGVDAGAAAAIHDALLGLAADGAAVIIVSQDLDELLGVCHSIMAICAGKTSDVFPAKHITMEEIGLLMGGAALDGLQATDGVVNGQESARKFGPEAPL